MPAHVKANGRIIVTLWRLEDVLDVTIAENSERALKSAIIMLAGLDALEPGDRLIVSGG
jgi:hypothetical protein